MSHSLILSDNDLRNTTLNCDSLGIRYLVTSEAGLIAIGNTTEVRRLDGYTNQPILVGVWERHKFESDDFKFPNGQTIPVSSFLTRHRGFARVEWSFVGDDGRRYTWKVNSSEVALYDSGNGGNGTPIAIYHRRRILFGRRNAYLELLPGYERTLDTLVLTFLYVEWKHRRAQQAAASG